MRDKILTYKISRNEGWPSGWYFKVGQYNTTTDSASRTGYRVSGAIYDTRGVIRYACFLIVEDESLFTVKGRI